MAEINTVCNLTTSRLVGAVDRSLKEAQIPRGFDTSSSFYALEGMSGKLYRFFINTLVKQLGDAAYLEVGSWAGSTLCSAIHDNKIRALAIDNWSQFGGPKDLFFKNLRAFTTSGVSVRVIEADFRSVDYKTIGLFDIFLFDGPHGEKDQYDGLKLALDALGDEFVFIVDDWNWSQVRQGTAAAIRECDLDVLYAAEIRTTLDDSHPPKERAFRESDWHNGY